MQVNGMSVSLLIYGLEMAADYFRKTYNSECTVSYAVAPGIAFERLIISHSTDPSLRYCLVMDEGIGTADSPDEQYMLGAQDVQTLFAAEGESDRVIALADDVALENHTLGFVNSLKCLQTEELSVPELLNALEPYRSVPDATISLRFQRRRGPERFDLYVGDECIRI